MTGEVAVVIVTYNSAGVIASCLDCIPGLPVVVVDNASQDATVDLLATRGGVRLIANQDNRGFAAAVNQAVAELDSEFILLLNPDVQLQSPAQDLVNACRRSGAALATGQLLDLHGQVQRGFTVRRLPTPAALIFEVLGWNRLLPHNPVNRRYRCLDLDLGLEADVDQPPGAFLLFRRQVWAQLAGFDPAFHPLWFEDVDFCKRALEQKHRIRYVPRITALHEGANSISTLNRSCREVYWYASLLRYARKHFRTGTFRGVSAAVVLGSVARALIGVVRRRSGELFAAHVRIIRLAAVCAIRGYIPGP